MVIFLSDKQGDVTRRGKTIDSSAIGEDLFSEADGGGTKIGKVYENMIINLSPFNEKLKRRVIRIVTEILSCGEKEAVSGLEANDWNIRKAVTEAE